MKLLLKSGGFRLFCKPFHHADDPRRLLDELHRVLKPAAPALVIGETPVYPSGVIVRRVKNVIKMITPSPLYKSKPVKKLAPSFEELFPPDLESRDHYYRIQDYQKLFDERGFVLHWRRTAHDTVFVAVKKG